MLNPRGDRAATGSEFQRLRLRRKSLQDNVLRWAASPVVGVGHRGNVTSPSDDRSTLAKAYVWSTRIMVVSLEMVLPGLVGFWIDRRLGTVCVFLLIGLAAGVTFGIRHLIRLTKVIKATEVKRSSHEVNVRKSR